MLYTTFHENVIFFQENIDYVYKYKLHVLIMNNNIYSTIDKHLQNITTTK